MTESEEEEDQVDYGAPPQTQKTSPVMTMLGAPPANPVKVSGAPPTYPVKVSGAPPADRPPKQVASQTGAPHPAAKSVPATSQKQDAADTARRDNSWDSSR